MDSIKNYVLEKKHNFISLLLLIFLMFSLYYNYSLSNNEKIIYKDKIVYKDKKIETSKISVDIKGYVKNPGVYTLNDGSRVIDLINVSGGLKKNANTRLINLSKILKDEDNIVIYSNDEIKKTYQKEIIKITSPCICEEIKNDGCIKDTNDNNLININTATKEELMNLEGIGEAKANAIIEYRNNTGSFEKIEDIINVNGISETIYNNIKKNITV